MMTLAIIVIGIDIALSTITSGPPQASILENRSETGLIVFVKRLLRERGRIHLILCYPFTLACAQNNRPSGAIQNNKNIGGHIQEFCTSTVTISIMMTLALIVIVAFFA